MIGAFFDDTPRGESSGSAYIFTRNGTLWSEQQKLIASDGGPIDDFGYSATISGDTIVVGSTGADTPSGTNTGSAYVYTRAGNLWTEQQKLAAADGADTDFFGSSVAFNGNTVFVGAFFDDLAVGDNAGSAYVFAEPGVSVGGRVSTPSGLALRNAVVVMTDSQNVRRTATTSSFGLYSFDNIRIGETYTIGIQSKRFRFSPRILQFAASVNNLDFTGFE